jgi:hypothetical protein
MVEFKSMLLPKFLLSIAIALFITSCGSASENKIDLSDEAISAAEISLTSLAPYGWGPPEYCDPNNTIDYSQPIDPNSYQGCFGGWVQQITKDGVVLLDQGCFTGYSQSPAEVLATQCVSLKHSEKQLSPSEWLVVKRQLLRADPLSLNTMGCEDDGVMCVSDFATITLVFNKDGQQKTIQWPSSADGLPTDLQNIIALLKNLGFVLLE